MISLKGRLQSARLSAKQIKVVASKITLNPRVLFNKRRRQMAISLYTRYLRKQQKFHLYENSRQLRKELLKEVFEDTKKTNL